MKHNVLNIIQKHFWSKRTHTQNQATTISQGRNWPRVKTMACDYSSAPQFQSYCKTKTLYFAGKHTVQRHPIFQCFDIMKYLQNIPRNMHTVFLCFALLWLCNRSQWIHMKYLSIFIRVALLALGQSLDCHSASEVSLMDMGKSVNV